MDGEPSVLVRKNAEIYGIDQMILPSWAFPQGGIQAGEFLMHYDEDVAGTALDSTPMCRMSWTPFSPILPPPRHDLFLLWPILSVGNMDTSWLTEGNCRRPSMSTAPRIPYRQFQQQYDVISGMGISTGRIVLKWLVSTASAPMVVGLRTTPHGWKQFSVKWSDRHEEK